MSDTQPWIADNFGDHVNNLIDQLLQVDWTIFKNYTGSSPISKEQTMSKAICDVDICDDPATVEMGKGGKNVVVCADCAETFFTPFGYAKVS